MERFEADGFAIVPRVAGAVAVDGLLAAIAKAETAGRRGSYAIRNLLSDVPAVCEWTESAACRDLVEPILGRDARAVRGILFDKTPDANWKVPWHQDLSIAVAERIDIAGFGPWSMKAGVVHVQPPDGVLRKMVSLRLHLDDCREESGPLRVIPGSHTAGRSPEPPRNGRPAVACLAPRGSALLMRPLLWHASSAATRPGHRRVIHIEFSGALLPGGLRWVS
ncbi:MAG: phytanoyl-CoA dioxygenase family protein [Acidobacteria bacterium]|nr:phytanoyl-CoA dioxygenase family protein [Acidobacteriota bacterium]